jgi:hypothetical protein
MIEPEECPNCHFGQCELSWIGEPNSDKYCVVCPACELNGPATSNKEDAVQAWNDLPRRCCKREPIEIIHSFSFDSREMADLFIAFVRNFYQIKKNPNP